MLRDGRASSPRGPVRGRYLQGPPNAKLRDPKRGRGRGRNLGQWESHLIAIMSHSKVEIAALRVN